MSLVTRDEETGFSELEQMIAMPSAPAPPDTGFHQAMEWHIDSEVEASIRDVEEPGGTSVPEDLENLGLLATVNLDDGQEILRLVQRVDTRLHAAACARDLSRLRELVAAGAPLDALDWDGNTPLHHCVAERLMEPLQELLRVPAAADVPAADVRDARGVPLLHVAILLGWADGACAALAAGARVDTFVWDREQMNLRQMTNRYADRDGVDWKIFVRTPIDLSIETGDMEVLDKILAAAERTGTIDCRNGLGYTALRTAIRERNLPAVQALVRRGASPHKISADNESALHVAALYSDPDILKYLLEHTNATITFDRKGEAPIHTAVHSDNEECVKLILDKFGNAKLGTRDGKKNTPLHIAAGESKNLAAMAILRYDGDAMLVGNAEGDTPLITAVQSHNRDLVAHLLNKGAITLSTKDRNGVSILEFISSHFHEASDYFNLVLDQFINRDSNTKRIVIDYRVLTRSEDVTHIEVLEEFVNCGQSKVLIHPVIKSLIYLKWSVYKWLFYFMAFLYSWFLISLNAFLITTFIYKDQTSGDENPGPTEFGGPWYWLLIAFVYFTICLLLVQESFFIRVKGWRRYLASLESWLKLLSFPLCALAPLVVSHAPSPWPRHAACAALLLAWLQAMILASNFPYWGYYVPMFWRVAVDILKIFVMGLFLVLAFAFCFMIEYQSAAPFDGPFAAFVKTLFMMSSEFEYEGLVETNEELQVSKTFVRILFVFFLFFVAIVLMNFMIGVAVSDINALNETGNITRLEMQVSSLSTFDTLVNGGRFGGWLKKKFGDKRYHKMLSNDLEIDSSWKMVCSVEDRWQDCDEFRIEIRSATLLSEIVDLANKNYGREEKEKNEKTFQTKIDELYDTVVESPTDEHGRKIKLKPNDSNTIKKHIKSMVNDLAKLSHEVENVKRSNEVLDLKVSEFSARFNEVLDSKMAQFAAKSAEILAAIKEMSDTMSLNQNAEQT